MSLCWLCAIGRYTEIQSAIAISPQSFKPFLSLLFFMDACPDLDFTSHPVLRALLVACSHSLVVVTFILLIHLLCFYAFATPPPHTAGIGRADGQYLLQNQIV